MVLPFYIFSEVTSLLTVRICSRVIISISFQKVDCAPDTKTCSESNNKSLQYIYRTIKKAHIVVAGILGISLVFCFLNTQKPEWKPLCGSRFRRLLSIFSFVLSFRLCWLSRYLVSFMVVSSLLALTVIYEKRFLYESAFSSSSETSTSNTS